MEVFLFIIARVIISFLLGQMGAKRDIGFGWSFAFSFIISPIIALIIILCSKKKDIAFVDITKEN